MFTIKQIENEMANQLKTLREARKSLLEMTEIRNWESMEFQLPIDNDISIGDDCAIYIFESSESKPKIVRDFKRVSSKNKVNHYSRLNNASQSSKALYVGSSRHLRVRLRQHLGVKSLVSRSTYSLWLDDWFTGKVKVSYYIFKESFEQETLQMIEDIVWEMKQPLFGKKGGRG